MEERARLHHAILERKREPRRWRSIPSRKLKGKPTEPSTRREASDQTTDPHPDTQPPVHESQGKKAGGWVVPLAAGVVVGGALGFATSMSPGIIAIISAATVVLVRVVRNVLF